MKNTKIAWTDHSWNPWHGCTKISPGCKNCYAAAFSKRTGHDIWGSDKPRRFFGEKHWSEPLKWDKEAKKAGIRRRVFCASMADVFETHKNLTIEQDLNGQRTMLAHLIMSTPWLDWLLLTKRPESAMIYLTMMFPYRDDFPANIWIGTTAENQEMANKRVKHLLQVPAAKHFLSVEPMLEPISLEEISHSLWGDALVSGIDWIIVGGESGPGCRPFDPHWARLLRNDCRDAGIKFFMKQLGGVHNHRDQLEDLPEDLQIREVPA